METRRHSAGAGKGQDGKGQGGRFRAAGRASDVTPGATLTLNSRQQAGLPHEEPRRQSSHEVLGVINNAAYEFASLAENDANNIPPMVHKASERQIMGQTPSWGEPDTQERACASIRDSARKVLALQQMKLGHDIPPRLIESANRRLHVEPAPEDTHEKPFQAQWNEVIAGHATFLLAVSHVHGTSDELGKNHLALVQAGEALPARGQWTSK